MRVFNKDKTIELTDYNLENGYLKKDKIFVAHHDAVEAVEEKGHYEVIAEYENGGKDVKWVVDVPEVEGKEAYDEYEDILIYIPYTAEELTKIKQEKYEQSVSDLIRERYSLNQELAILRQRDIKKQEYAEYNTYAEQCKIKAKNEYGI